MSLLPSRLLRFLALAVLLFSVLPARAQVAVQSSPLTVNTSDGVRIYVNHKFGPAPLKIPVLLIHGTWGNSSTWDFPGRSVMDYLAVRGYDVYALDMRGMGLSDNPGYSKIDLFTRLNDAIAVAQHIVATTHQVPVVMGWSQGGLITGLLATSHPELVAGVGLLSTAPNGFLVPTQFPDLSTDLNNLIGGLLGGAAISSFIPSSNEVNEIVFGTDPITGKSTISPDALATFTSTSTSPPFLQPDSVQAILEETQQVPPPQPGCPLFVYLGLVKTCAVVPWQSINVPVLVVDGDLDPLVGEENATALFEAVGSKNKQLIIFPRNSHGWFLEDNHDATDRVFDRFLSQFGQ